MANVFTAKTVTKAKAKEKLVAFRGTLIGAGMNAKTSKGDKLGEYVTAIMYLLPADSVEGVNLCAKAHIARCKEGCLVSAGRGRFDSVYQARKRKTEFYRDDKAGFMAALVNDVEKFVAWCAKRNVKPAVRLNGTSDIQFERGHPVIRNGQQFASIFEAFPNVRFYDYTKITQRLKRAKRLPVNYSLTLSYSEANTAYASDVLETAQAFNANVAVVYRDKPTRANDMDKRRYGMPVIDGDKTDLRFTDPAGVIVGLYAKGEAKHDDSGFVID